MRASSTSNAPRCTCTSRGYPCSLHAQDGPLTYEHVARVAEARLHLAPRLRQRVLRVPAGLARPLWVDDDRFDLDFHLRRSAIPSPGRPPAVGTSGGTCALASARPREAALGAVRVRRARTLPNRRAAEDAPCARRRDLGDVDRLRTVRPRSRRGTGRPAEAPVAPGASSRPRGLGHRCRPRSVAASDGGSRARRGGARARRRGHRRDPGWTALDRRQRGGPQRTLRHPCGSQPAFRHRGGAVRTPAGREDGLWEGRSTMWCSRRSRGAFTNCCAPAVRQRAGVRSG